MLHFLSVLYCFYYHKSNKFALIQVLKFKHASHNFLLLLQDYIVYGNCLQTFQSKSNSVYHHHYYHHQFIMMIMIIIIILSPPPPPPSLEWSPKSLKKRLRELETKRRMKTIEAAALLRSARILRRVLLTWGELLSLRHQWKTTYWRSEIIIKSIKRVGLNVGMEAFIIATQNQSLFPRNY